MRALLAAQEALTRKLVTELNAFHKPVLRDRQRAVLRRRHAALAAPHCRRHRRDGAGAAGETPHRAEHRQQVGEDREPASRGVDLQLPLRHATGDGGDELRAEQGHRRRRDRFPWRRRRRLPDGRRGTSSSPAAACTTISTTRSPQAMRMEPLRIPASQPGGGSRALRRQLKILSDFVHGFDFVTMKPDDAVIKGGVPPGGTARALVERGRAIAIYLRRRALAGKAALDTGRGQSGCRYLCKSSSPRAAGVPNGSTPAPDRPSGPRTPKAEECGRWRRRTTTSTWP